MGMFDEIGVSMKCPYCQQFCYFLAQTKDLDNWMYHYKALPSYWFEPCVMDKTKTEKEFRAELPVFPKFPLDKEAGVWSSQAERAEAAAMVTDTDYADKLNYVSVIATCLKCHTTFTGKIKVHEGMLFGEIYDCKA